MSTVLPLCCFPPIHWLKSASRGPLVLDIHENYPKQTFRNRFEILGVNGKLTLSIPVVGQNGVKTAMRDIKLNDGNWRKTHLTSIQSAYGRSAYFEHYFDDIEKIFSGKQTFLLDLNIESVEWIKRTGVSINYHLSEEPIAFQSGVHDAFEPSQKWPELPSYPQVFSDRFGFCSNLSVIDLVMNKGPRMIEYLDSI